MPSPFPGMNPYLERAPVWRGFHQGLVYACTAQLVAQVRPRYYVTQEPTLYVHEPPAEDRRLLGSGDIGLSVPRRPAGGAAGSVAAPLYATLPAAIDIEEVFALEIRERDGGGLVTVIEILSPTNKYAGPDREQYLRKRQLMLRSRTNLVEIDLLRGGPVLPPDDVPPSDYRVLVSRVDERPRVGVWPWGLRDPMPVVPVPLRDPDPDARLDLKAALDRVYDDTGYGDYFYAGSPEPRLAPDAAAWAATFLPTPPG